MGQWAGFIEQGWALTEQAGCFGNRLFGCCWVGMRSQHIPCKQIILNFFGKITLILSSMNRTEPGNVLHEWPRMHAIIGASFFKFLHSYSSFYLTIWRSVLGSSRLFFEVIFKTPETIKQSSLSPCIPLICKGREKVARQMRSRTVKPKVLA